MASRSNEQNTVTAKAVGEREWKNIAIGLRDVFARFQKERIFNWYGFEEISDESEEIANRTALGEENGSSNFIRGSDVFGYLWKNLRKEECGNVVNIVIPGLRNIYYKYRGYLTRDEQDLLEIVMKRPLPQFENIWDYPSLERYRSEKNISEYQLFGSITPYDVLHIPVVYFIEAINNKKPILSQLHPLEVIVNIVYSQSDFWDFEHQRIIDNINLNTTCG